MSINIEGILRIPDDVTNVEALGEFFGYDRDTARTLWNETMQQFRNLSENTKGITIGRVIPQFLSSLQDDPHAFVRFVFLSILVGFNQGFYDKLNEMGTITLN